MHRRYDPPRGGQRAHRQDVVPRELAVQIARERDELLEELKRTQSAYRRLQSEREALLERLDRAELNAPPPGRDDTTRIEQLEAEIKTLRQALDERAASAEQEASEEQEALITSLLRLRDSIERAQAMAQSPDDPWRQGLAHMIAQFDEILTAHGWSTLAEPGDRFDPSVHEAVETIGERGETLHVERVARQGFEHAESGHVIRPAQVVVSASSESIRPS